MLCTVVLFLWNRAFHLMCECLSYVFCVALPLPLPLLLLLLLFLCLCSRSMFSAGVSSFWFWFWITASVVWCALLRCLFSKMRTLRRQGIIIIFRFRFIRLCCLLRPRKWMIFNHFSKEIRLRFAEIYRNPKRFFLFCFGLFTPNRREYAVDECNAIQRFVNIWHFELLTLWESNLIDMCWSQPICSMDFMQNKKKKVALLH